jgi:hypothetical protein
MMRTLVLGVAALAVSVASASAGGYGYRHHYGYHRAYHHWHYYDYGYQSLRALVRRWLSTLGTARLVVTCDRPPVPAQLDAYFVVRDHNGQALSQGAW